MQFSTKNLLAKSFRAHPFATCNRHTRLTVSLPFTLMHTLQLPAFSPFFSSYSSFFRNPLMKFTSFLKRKRVPSSHLTNGHMLQRRWRKKNDEARAFPLDEKYSFDSSSLISRFPPFHLFFSLCLRSSGYTHISQSSLPVYKRHREYRRRNAK